MFCESCGKPNPDDARTCESCGAKLASGGSNGGPPRKKTSGLAIASFVVALVGLLTCVLAFVMALPALVLGIVALVKIGKSEGRLGGQGLAIAGVCLAGADLLFVPIVAAIAIPNLLQSRIAANETMAAAQLRAYASAQVMFHKIDRYGKGKLVYANPKDGRGFADLYEVGGERLMLIEESFARATSPASAKSGYYFADIEYDDYSTDCGLCAVPAVYNRSGRNTFIIDVTGAIYQKDTGGEPVRKYPDTSEGWLPIELY